MSPLQSISVVIPACNEEVLIESCLASVFASVLTVRRELGAHAPAIDVVVVADRCEDATVALARAAGATVATIEARSVGTARRTGVALALRRGLGPHARRWIANTDADSTVPTNWLVDQVAIAGRGFEVMIGTVRPDFADLTPEQEDLWRATHARGFANGHVHGANLGVRADAYLAAGGFLDAAESEDTDLVERLAARGARMLATDGCEVVTSGRQLGRTPGGYAGYLRDQLTAMRATASGWPQ